MPKALGIGVNMRLSPSAICVALVASVGPAACCSGASGGHPPTPSATGAPAAAPSALAPAGWAAQPRSLRWPTPPECEALWERYHAVVPDDPYVARDSFIARCSRSTRQVLTCPERAREQVIDIVRQSPFERDGGIEGPPEEQVVGALLHVAMPSRTGICIARERLRFALDAGELASLAREAAAGRWAPGEHGLVVVDGTFATLPSLGMVEEKRSTKLGPPGEVRLGRRADGRVWLYFLGGLLGRHQNQVGFVYSSAPFVDHDFAPEPEGHQQLCLEPNEQGRAPRQRRYMLSCFTVVDRLSPQLIEVGSAPD
jgi:hypothetical protein